MYGENRPRILIVEDDANIRQILCVFLEYSRFDVRGVANGQQAIELIPQYQPHLIVLDLKMRPVSGWDVLHWLRANRLTPGLPVIILTALTNLSQQLQGLEEGAIEYMTKPTQPSKVAERIRVLLSLSTEQRITLRRQRTDEHRKVMERLATY